MCTRAVFRGCTLGRLCGTSVRLSPGEIVRFELSFSFYRGRARGNVVDVNNGRLHHAKNFRVPGVPTVWVLRPLYVRMPVGIRALGYVLSDLIFVFFLRFYCSCVRIHSVGFGFLPLLLSTERPIPFP